MNAAIAFVLATAFLVSLDTPPQIDTAHTVCRYDFEQATRGVPNDWYPTYTDWLPTTSEYIIFNWDPDVSYTGKHSISIELAKNFPPVERSYDRIDYNWLVKPRLEANTVYRISFWWMARDPGTRGFVHIRGDDVPEGRGQPEYIRHMPPLATTDELVYEGREWKQYVIDVQTPKRLKYFEVRLGLSWPRGVGHKIWFDDFEIAISPRQRERR